MHVSKVRKLLRTHKYIQTYTHKYISRLDTQNYTNNDIQIFDHAALKLWPSFMGPSPQPLIPVMVATQNFLNNTN